MLLDEIKRLKEEIAKEKVVEEKAEEIKEEVKEEAPEEKEEKKPKPEIKEDITEVKEERKVESEDVGAARLRRELAAERRRAQELEKEIAESKKPKETMEIDEEEAPIRLSPEVQEVVQEHRRRSAEEEFLSFESHAKKVHTDAGAVLNEYAVAMYQSLKIQNPKKSDVELNKMTKNAILMQAGEYARAGHENPVEEMYHTAKELGYTGNSFQKAETKPEPKEEELKPDLKKVAENRKRSTGMTANNGLSEGLMTLTAATDLTAAEWAKLPKAEKQRLLYGQ